MIITRPGRLISLLDLVPTITDMVGVDHRPTSGRSLTEPRSPERPVLVEGSLNGYETKAAYVGEYKLIKSQGDAAEFGYTVPDETQVELPADVATQLRDVFPPWPDGTTAETEVSGVVEDRLEKLGYK